MLCLRSAVTERDTKGLEKMWFSAFGCINVIRNVHLNGDVLWDHKASGSIKRALI